MTIMIFSIDENSDTTFTSFDWTSQVKNSRLCFLCSTGTILFHQIFISSDFYICNVISFWEKDKKNGKENLLSVENLKFEIATFSSPKFMWYYMLYFSYFRMSTKLSHLKTFWRLCKILKEVHMVLHPLGWISLTVSLFQKFLGIGDERDSCSTKSFLIYFWAVFDN